MIKLDANNGNLVIEYTAENDHDSWVELLDEPWDEFESSLSETIQYLGYEFISPESIGALTDAPIIGRDVEFEIAPDHSSFVSNHNGIWWFPNYAVTNPWRELIENGRVVFERADD